LSTLIVVRNVELDVVLVVVRNIASDVVFVVVVASVVVEDVASLTVTVVA